MTKKTKDLILMYLVHFILWTFVLSKLNLGFLYFIWGVIMTNWYIRIMERND